MYSFRGTSDEDSSVTPEIDALTLLLISCIYRVELPSKVKTLTFLFVVGWILILTVPSSTERPCEGILRLSCLEVNTSMPPSEYIGSFFKYVAFL